MDLIKDDFCEPSADSPLLLAELTPGRARQFDWKSSCETWSVAFSPDGAWFAWSQGHCIVKLIPWPPPEANLRMHTFEQKDRCTKATDVKLEGSGYKEKTLNCGQIVWSLAFKVYSCKIDQSSGLPGLILATGLNDGHIKIWAVLTGHLLFNLSGHSDVVRDLCFTPNKNQILVSASRDKTIRIWDLKKDGKQIQVLSGHLKWVYCCSISPDSSMMCSAAGEPSVLLWSLRSYTLIRKLEGHQGSVVSCDFSPDAAVLVTASYDLSVIMWDPYTGEKLREFCHEGLRSDLVYRSTNSQLNVLSLRSVRFSPEGLYLATVADDGFLRTWDLDMKSPITLAHVSNGLCCTFYPQGGIIATGTRDGQVQFWMVPRDFSPLKHLCRKALRRFLTTYQVLALPIPKKIKAFLTYRTTEL